MAKRNCHHADLAYQSQNDDAAIPCRIAGNHPVTESEYENGQECDLAKRVTADCMRQVERRGEPKRLNEQEAGGPVENGGCGEKGFCLSIGHGSTSVLSGGQSGAVGQALRPPKRGVFYSASLVEYPQHARPVDHVLACAGVELTEQVFQVPLDGFVADPYRLRNLLVRHVAGQ